jgi:hypothetical protein
MSDPEFVDIAKKLDVIIRLIAISLTSGRKKQDQFSILDRAGFRPREIAEIVGTTPNTVSVFLSNIRRSRNRKAKDRSQ